MIKKLFSFMALLLLSSQLQASDACKNITKDSAIEDWIACVNYLSESRQESEKATFSSRQRADAVCAAKNDDFDWGRSYPMLQSNNCATLCRGVEGGACFGLVMLHPDGEHSTGGTCDYTPAQQYFDEGSELFCCCR